MCGHRPRDRDRFEREMRVWGRRFERDMRAMGDDIAREMGDSFAAASEDEHGGRRPNGSYASDWGWRDARRRERDARRRARWERRAARAERRAGAYAAWRRGRPSRMLFYYWWLIFPLFFMGRGAMHGVGGPERLAAASGDWLTAVLNFSLAAPVAHMVSDALGVSFLSAYGLLAALVVVTGAAAVIGLKRGAPRRAY
jgi:hypothetical protein